MIVIHSDVVATLFFLLTFVFMGIGIRGMQLDSRKVWIDQQLDAMKHDLQTDPKEKAKLEKTSQYLGQRSRRLLAIAVMGIVGSFALSLVVYHL